MPRRDQSVVATAKGAGVISQATFETAARAFLDANAPRRPEDAAFEWGAGSDEVSIFEETSPAEETHSLELARNWRTARFDAGFGWITGPEELGGRGLPDSYERVYVELEQEYVVPNQNYFSIGLGMVAPTILEHGTAATKSYLRRLYRGDLVACQLFSEPEAGSDLANVRTRARRDGDGWILDGHKIWTSGAHLSDIGEVLCRTDPNLPKHSGLTMFIVDMRAPGVEIRPLRQMTGGARFNEVFLDGVHVPDDHRLGPVNAGWSVALTTLMNERASIGAGGTGREIVVLDEQRLLAMARHFGKADDPVVRDRLAELCIRYRVVALTSSRAAEAARMGRRPGPELSAAKLGRTTAVTATAELAAQLLGPRIAADTGEWGTYAWAQVLLGAPGMHIAGGTDEILKNVLAERVLGLPKEPRA